jgi:Glycosyltransferase family 87
MIMIRESALVVVSLVLAIVMWLFVQSVFIPHQLQEAAATNRPRGLLSDLYPRWYGARELLLHHRDPYGPDITLEIERGYYGRELNSALPGDPKDKQAFAYPIFVVFFLAPTLSQPFGKVQTGFYWLLIGLTVLSIPLWASLAQMRMTFLLTIAIILIVIGSFQFIQGLKLQQLTLLVAPLLAIALALLMRGQLLTAGAILAIALIKPQLSLPLAAWLLVWTVGDFKRRWRLAAGFLLATSILMAGSEVILSGWLTKFYLAVLDYRRYTGGESIPVMFLGRSLGALLEGMLIGCCLVLSWRLRKHEGTSREFAAMAALILSVTVVIIPMVALYNQVLLLLPMFVIWRARAVLWAPGKTSRTLLATAGAWCAWPWIGALLVLIAKTFEPSWALRSAWSVPLSSMLGFPLLVTMVILLNWRRLNDYSPTSEPTR